MTAENRRAFPNLPQNIQKIHIIGIAGTAMGSLAAMLKSKGFDVRGSDKMAYPPMSTWLEDQGIDIMIGYDEKNLDWNPDLVIVGNVCRSSYADAVAMRDRNIAHLSFPEALRHFFMRRGNNIVVTGTHGKTTTTSLIAWSLFHAQRDPSFFVGGITGNFDSNFRLGQDPFVVEGDEYDTAYFDKVPKFWHYSPYRATINNIEFDHADIYPDLESVKHVFRRLVKLIPEYGTLWVNGDDANALEVSEERDCVRYTFGLGEGNHLRATDIEYGDVISCNVTFLEKDLGRFELPMVGEFNLRNMLGAIGICLDENVDPEVLKAGFKQFKSVKKRQELIAEVKGIKIFDDFAHHPTAVEATLSAMRKRFPNQKIWGIFEAKSNTSRRAVFQHDYPRALSIADQVVISKPWRKDEDLPPEKRLSIDQLVADIKDTGTPIELIENVDDIATYVAEHAQSGDIIVGLSGSSFGGLHQKIVDRLNLTQ